MILSKTIKLTVKDSLSQLQKKICKLNSRFWDEHCVDISSLFDKVRHAYISQSSYIENIDWLYERFEKLTYCVHRFAEDCSIKDALLRQMREVVFLIRDEEEKTHADSWKLVLSWMERTIAHSSAELSLYRDDIELQYPKQQLPLLDTLKPADIAACSAKIRRTKILTSILDGVRLQDNVRDAVVNFLSRYAVWLQLVAAWECNLSALDALFDITANIVPDEHSKQTPTINHDTRRNKKTRRRKRSASAI